MEPLVGLIRRFAVGFITGHDASVCTEIMAPDYVLRIGPHVLRGRDLEYRPAVQTQLDQFPGLVMTIHALVTNGDQVALHFTEHGASLAREGRVACWAGIALYRWNGKQLTECAAEEDYFARRRQLTTGTPDPVDPPMPAPWDTRAEAPDPQAEGVVRRWLAEGRRVTTLVGFDDEHLVGSPPLVLEAVDTEVTDLFSADRHVAFHVRQTGRYISGFPELADAAGSTVDLYSSGLATVADGEVRAARIIRGRLELYGALRGASNMKGST